MEVKVVRVTGKNEFLSTKIDCEDTIKQMYAEGYNLKGVIPAVSQGYGTIVAVDLVFER